MYTYRILNRCNSIFSSPADILTKVLQKCSLRTSNKRINFVQAAEFAKKNIKPEDHWSCIAHLIAEDMLKSAVIEEKKFKNIECKGFGPRSMTDLDLWYS